MAMRKYMTLDVVRRGRESARGLAHRLTIHLDVDTIVINEVGPAGGHPEIMFIGTEEDLNVVRNRYDSGSVSDRAAREEALYQETIDREEVLLALLNKVDEFNKRHADEPMWNEAQELLSEVAEKLFAVTHVEVGS